MPGLRFHHLTFLKYGLILFVLCQTDNTTGISAVACAADTVRDREQQRIDTIARIAPTVVCVMPPGGQGGGSGVLISADGYAISNYHVTSGSGNFMKCGLNDGQVYDAVIVGIDPTGDVALIKLLGRDDFPFCTPGDSETVRTGDEVLALGNPFLLASDFTPTVTYGIVSGVRRYQYPAGTFLEYTDCIQIDASINPGNSGGPLFDINGRWIGINGRASFEKRGRINTGAAYAISVRQVLLFVDHLKSGRIVDHGRTNFTVGTYDGAVEVQQVSNLSEAWRRGMRPGDELLSFGGRALTSANDFKNIMGIFPEQTRVPLEFRNADGVQKITVRMSSLHDFEAAPQLPEERRPQRQPKDADPDHDTPDDDDPHGHGADEDEPQVPAQYAHLFEEKKGFANAYFNRLNTDRFMKPLEESLAAAAATAESKGATGDTGWTLRVSAAIDAAEYVGELTVGPKGAGLDLAGLAAQLQPADNIDPTNESPQLYGLLTGLLQWQRLFRNDRRLFSEVSYFGAEQLLPAEDDRTKVHVVIVQDGPTISRWYFDEQSPWPVGVDVVLSAGADEGRIRFADWNTSGELPLPDRIGVVDSNSETINWIKVDSIEVKRPNNNKSNNTARNNSRAIKVNS